ncbi:hypothetical protein EJB05_47587, partial [Eragrostis curvula]
MGKKLGTIDERGWNNQENALEQSKEAPGTTRDETTKDALKLVRDKGCREAGSRRAILIVRNSDLVRLLEVGDGGSNGGNGSVGTSGGQQIIKERSGGASPGSDGQQLTDERRAERRRIYWFPEEEDTSSGVGPRHGPDWAERNKKRKKNHDALAVGGESARVAQGGGDDSRPSSPAPLPLRRRRRRAMDSDSGPRRAMDSNSDTDTVLELRMKAAFLKNVSEVLRELFSTANFKFSSTGLQLRATDASAFALVVSDPNICDDDNLSVRLNLADMAKASSFANNDDIVTIKYENDRKIITISLDSPEGAVISDLDFDFDFMGVNSMLENLEYPYEYEEHLYDAIVRMPSAKFMQFCNKLSSFWDTGDRKTVLYLEPFPSPAVAAVCISVDKDRVSFSTDGEFKSSTIVCLQTQNNDKPNEATCIEMKKKISLTFDLRYLKNFSNGSTLSDQVTIKLSPNLTAVFESKTANMGYIRYRMRSDSSDSPAPPPLCCSPPVMAPATILELRMEQATFLKNLLEVLSLSGLFSKANFKFSSAGLELQATDTCCFALVELQLRSEAFNSYSCNNNGLSVGLILADMAKASSFANNDDIITIEAQDGVEAVVIKFNSPDGSVIQNFKLNFVSINDVPVPIPEYQEFQYEAIIRMPSAEFMHICNQLSSLTDMETVRYLEPFSSPAVAFVRISVDKDRVKFFTDGRHGYLTIKCQLIQTVDKSKEATYIEVKMKENVSLTFGLRYMSSLCKAYTLSQQVTIKLSSKLPAVFEYNIAEKGYIRYHVMPAEITEMEEDEDEDEDAELMTSGDKHDPFA